MYTVTIKKTKQQITAGHGECLSDVLRRAGLAPSMPCGGKGRCGKCTVSANGTPCLSCQTYVTEDMEIDFPDEDAQIQTDGLTRAAAYSARGSGFGAAVDLGTTTIAVSVVDLSSRRVLHTAAELNEQKSYGADIISRITYCMEHENGTLQLSQTAQNQIAHMIRAAASGKPITKLVVAGNTVMEHILLEQNPAPLACAPFSPVFTDGQNTVVNNIPAYIMPCISAYIGGDITASMLACSMDTADDVCLLLDIGTNGEMVLKKDNTYYCCSVAAGPALEGGHISCGTGSIAGAVCKVRLSDGLIYADTIGSKPSVGICGSGLIDAAAELLRDHIIDGTGQLLPRDKIPAMWRRYIASDASCVTLTPSVTLTQKDIRELQTAKAAIRAGIDVLLQRASLTYDDVNRVFLAGGLGTHLPVKSACTIGMLPTVWANKISAVGNTALGGAVSVLTDDTLRSASNQLRTNAVVIELGNEALFADLYLKYMDFA